MIIDKLHEVEAINMDSGCLIKMYPALVNLLIKKIENAAERDRLANKVK
jgi:hypothetical protein